MKDFDGILLKLGVCLILTIIAQRSCLMCHDSRWTVEYSKSPDSTSPFYCLLIVSMLPNGGRTTAYFTRKRINHI